MFITYGISQQPKTGNPGTVGQYIDQYQAVYNSFSTKPSDEIAVYQNAMVTDLVNAGMWFDMDLFYVFANDASDNALINWVNPGTFDCTRSTSSLAFDAYEGFTGTGVTGGFLDTNWDASTNGVNFTQNDAAFGAYTRSEISEAAVLIGSNVPWNHINPRYSDVWRNARINGASSINLTAGVTTSVGMHIVTRRTTTNAETYYNGETWVERDNNTSEPVGTNDWRILNDRGANYSTRQISIAFVRNQMSDADVSIFNNIIETYMFNIGAGVQYIPEYQAIYDSYSTKPDASIAIAQNRLVRTLRDASIWDRMDLFYIFANNDASNAFINWANPGTYDCALSLTPPEFTTYEGFTGNGVDSYLETGYNPSLNYVNISANSSTIGVYILNECSTGNTAYVLGANDYPKTLLIAPRYNDDIRVFVNSDTALVSTTDAVTSTLGSFFATRTSDTALAAYKNGINIASGEDDVIGLPNTEFLFFRATTYYTNAQVAIGFLMDGISDEEAVTLNAAIETYMETIGANVQFTPEYQAVYNSFSTKPDASIAAYQNTLVSDLVDEGLWTRMDLFYLLANDASDNALLNWIGPDVSFNAYQDGGASEFIAYEGFTGTGSTRILADYAFNVDNTNYTQNSATLAAYVRTNITEDEGVIGCHLSQNIYLRPRTVAGDQNGRLNGGGIGESVDNAYGFAMITRTASDAQALYKNGILLDTDSDESAAIPDGQLSLLSRGVERSTNQVSLGIVMDGLSDADASALNNIVETYMFNIGKNVQYIPEYRVIYDSFSTKPTDEIALAQNRLVRTLRDAGLWTKMDLFYMFANDASDNALINWANPGTFDCTVDGSALTFDAYEGFTGGLKRYLNTNYIPASNTVNIGVDDLATGVYLRTDIAEMSYDFSCQGGSEISQQTKWSNEDFYAYHTTTGYITIVDVNSSGLWMVNRPQADYIEAYWNGVSQGSDTDTTDPDGLPAGYLNLLAQSPNASFSTRQNSCFFLMASVDDTDASTLNTAIETYMTAISDVFHPEYQAVYDAYSTKPDASTAIAQDTLVRALIDNNLWNRMDLFYMFANDASDNALINWANPGTFDCIFGDASILFTAYEGFTGDGVGSYLNTQWNPSTQAVNFTLDDNFIAVYSNLNVVSESYIIACNNTSSGEYLGIAIDWGGNTYMRNNADVGDSDSFADDNDMGFYISTRDSSTTVRNYKNGVLKASDHQSDVIPNNDLTILARNGAYNWSNQQVSFAGTGASLTVDDVSILNNIVETYMFNIGIGVQYIPEYQAIYDSFSTKPDASIALAQNRLVRTLRDEGLWDRMDLFYVFAQDASDNALINWVNPGTFDASAILAPEFTAYEGYTVDGVGSYLDTNYAPSDDAINLSLNSAAIGYYNRTDNPLTAYNDMGVQDGTHLLAVQVYGSDLYGAVNDDGWTNIADQPYGFKVAIRRDDSNVYIYDGGGQVDTDATSSTQIPANSYNVFIGARNINGSAANYAARQYSISFIGGGLTGDEVAILNTAVETYMDGIGKGVQ